MNVSVTLGNRQFNISQKGYERLECLLKNLLASVPDNIRDFVSGDAENRLADYFSSKISSENVLTDADVDAAFASLGLGSKGSNGDGMSGGDDVHDEDFTTDGQGSSADEPFNSDAGENSTSEESKADDAKSKIRKLHRSTADKVLAGVCGGLAEYYDFESIWIRIFLAVATLVFQQLWIPVVYVAMWIIMPRGDGADNGGVSFDDDGSSCSKGCLVIVIIALLILLPVMFLLGLGILSFMWSFIS